MVVATLVVGGLMPVAVQAQMAPTGVDNAGQPQNAQTTSSSRRSVLSPGTATTDDGEADPEQTPDTAVDGARLDQPDPAVDPALAEDFGRQNLRENTIDALKPRPAPDDSLTPGISVGSFILRPTFSQTVGVEKETVGKKTTTDRSYLQSGFKGSLVSDWSLHQLKIDSDINWQKTLSGQRKDDPQGALGAEFRLDLANATTANFRAGYSLLREDLSSANAVSNATTQADVSTYSAGADITHDLGLIRGTAGIDFERQTYGEATLDSGQLLSQKDRNENTTTVRSRIGYELSPALVPFLEASYARSIYDQHRDSLGYVRDSQLYAAKAGVQGDFGEKLRGELSTGYAISDFDDSRLKRLSAITFDGNATWSPRRGTDVQLGLRTEIEPSTAAGASGSVAYTANMALTQVIIDTLTGNLSSAYTLRDYSTPNVPIQQIVNLGGGLAWGYSRSIDLTANVDWERTTQNRAATINTFTAMIGIALKR